MLLIPFLTAGCAIGPRYHQPEVPAPENYRELGEPAARESMADFPWWEVFQDKALQGLIRAAIQSNYDLKIAAARVAEARAMIGLSRSDALPHSDFTFSAERDRNAKSLAPSLDRLTSTYASGFNTSWEIDLWGKLRQRIRASQFEWRASEQTRKGVLITLVADVARNYFQLRELDLELKIAEDTVVTRQETCELFEKRLAGGVASELETSQASGDLYETAAVIPNLKRQIAITENTLCVLLGRSPGPIERGESLSDQKKIPQLPASGLPSELLNRRPDVMEAEYVLKAANSVLGAEIGEFMPSLDLTNFIGGEGRTPSDIWNADGYVWNIGGIAKLPVFQGGKNVYNYRAAKARWEQAAEQYKKTVISAFADVSNSLADIRRYAEMAAQLEKEVEFDRKGTKLSVMRYDGGFSSYLEVLDAERRRYASETNLARVKGLQFIALSQLYRTLGGGWQEEKI